MADLDVIAGGCEDASFTLIQSVGGLARHALGRAGRCRGRARPAPAALAATRHARGRRGARAADSDLIERLVDLGGVLRAVVTDGQAGDWAIALQFGPGEVPAEPTTTVRIAHDDVHKMAKGDLAPLQAFLAGRVSIAGDMLLVMQLQGLISRADGRPPGPLTRNPRDSLRFWPSAAPRDWLIEGSARCGGR